MSQASFDPRDAASLAACPLVPAPRFGALLDIEPGQKRLILGRDGLYLEVRSLALHACIRVAEVAAPYGEVKEFLRPTGGALPLGWIRSLADIALAGRDVEVAAGVLLGDEGWRIEEPRTESSSGGHITYHDSFDDDRLLIDMHSHGFHAAYFSGTDNASDLSRKGPYIAVVLGRCKSSDTMSSVVRFVCPPYLIPLDFPALSRLGAL